MRSEGSLEREGVKTDRGMLEEGFLVMGGSRVKFWYRFDGRMSEVAGGFGWAFLSQSWVCECQLLMGFFELMESRRMVFGFLFDYS